MTKGIISQSMLNNLEYDNNTGKNLKMDSKTAADFKPTAMFIFAGCDLNAAAYHLGKSLEQPFANAAVTTIFVQESVRAEFVKILKPKLIKYEDNIIQDKSFQNALTNIKKLNAEKITGFDDNATIGATIVCNFTQEQISSGGNGASGVVTMHPFRTPKEAIALSGKEGLIFKNASIWHSDYSCAYEMVSLLNCENFFINCFQVSLEVLEKHIGIEKSFVAIEKSYHFEILPINGKDKIIVFPIGTIFAN